MVSLVLVRLTLPDGSKRRLIASMDQRTYPASGLKETWSYFSRKALTTSQSTY